MAPPVLSRATFVVVLAYVAAIGAAAVTLQLASELGLLWATVIADVVATLVVFAFSAGTNNSSMYDPYWSVAPVCIAGLWALHPEAQGEPARALLVVVLVNLWGWRLTLNWWRGWRGLDHEDWRYADMRPRAAWPYWLVSLAGFHGVPTVLVLLGCFALWPALVTGDRSLGIVDGIGALLTLAAIVLEALADGQLTDFRRQVAAARARGEVVEHPLLTTGLWAWSRHPNYLGEITFWIGLFVIGMGADPSAWWTAVGPVAMLLLFCFVSVPLIETRLRATRPQYADYSRRVPAILPWPPLR
jgi:steroid 5-alpha reductase family enzyme